MSQIWCLCLSRLKLLKCITVQYILTFLVQVSQLCHLLLHEFRINYFLFKKCITLYTTLISAKYFNHGSTVSHISSKPLPTTVSSLVFIHNISSFRSEVYIPMASPGKREPVNVKINHNYFRIRFWHKIVYLPNDLR